MSPCTIQADGLVELYFYDELSAAERQEVARHLTSCAECRAALEELRLIRNALADCPRVAAPPGGNWSAVLGRIDRAVAVEPARPEAAHGALPLASGTRRPGATLVAAAATVALVSAALVYQARDRRMNVAAPASRIVSDVSEAQPAVTFDPPGAPIAAARRADAGFAAVTDGHFERAKLVILGLASRDARSVSASDWAYERQLAGALLDDTRLYKQTAEARGLGTLAGVMSDLELVLLQTSLTEAPDAATLDRLQRLIRQRDLVSKMEVSKWF